MTKVSPDTIAAWTSLISVSGALLERIEDILKSADLPPLSWYDALLEIEKAGPAGLRPYELKERLLLPQYSTSRLLARVEKAGLIARQACEDDGRGQVVVLTEAGHATRQRMWPIYADQLTRLIEDRLPPEERQQLADLLGKLNTGSP